ncbi:hypothetical protein AB0D49_26570 [Streptomyces sp. NPDC048290]|uniref:hypothetical protein n=1 Tax=Streptomyces sp. NPDC048290 TaxID=3155811 RepID=UPI00343848B2
MPLITRRIRKDGNPWGQYGGEDDREAEAEAAEAEAADGDSRGPCSPPCSC